MALQVDDPGGNWIEVGPAERQALSGRIVFTGQGARVAIGPGCVDAGMRLEIGGGARVAIGARNHLGALFVHACPGAQVDLGDDIGINGLVRLLLHEPGRIAIGSGSLIAAEVDISVSDMHPVFDVATGARINAAGDVTIGARVWIGARSLVLKGTDIGHDTVIGAASVVTGAIPSHCTAAGNPARVLRRGTRWAMDLPSR